MIDTLVFESLNATLLAYSQIKTQYFLFRDHRAARLGKKPREIYWPQSQEVGSREKGKQTFSFCLSLGLRSADSKNNWKASLEGIQLYTLSFCRNLQLNGF